jgi:internalin A
MHGATTHGASEAWRAISNHRSGRRILSLRMSVRALMLFVLFIGGTLGWIVHLAHVQRNAVAAIRSAGGQAIYDWQLKRLPNGMAQLDPKGRPWAPSWLLDYLGPDYFGHVEDVTLETSNTDAVMKQVGQLDKLRVIRISTGIPVMSVAKAGLESMPTVGLSRFKGLFGLFTTGLNPPEFNGANFKYLRNLTRLENLQLPGNSTVTDADLTHLNKLTSLLGLELHDPSITDAGLVSLRNMTRLNSLALAGAQLSGSGLANLRAMKGLKFLNLSRSHVDDLAPIGHLTLLTNLHLSHTPIDDRGLAPIVGLTGLEMLRLNGTKITGASYAYLKHLPKLDDLCLQQTTVGDEGSAALAELKALIRLELDDTRITDVTLVHLAGLPKLKDLSLARTGITDRGLTRLIECKSLRRVNVRGTKITRDGLKEFQTARPRVIVVR